MALVEPLVGHLLSQYTETVLEGLEKIRANAAASPEFAPTIANSASAVEALKNTLLKQEKKPVVVSALQTICSLVEHCGSQPGSRAHLLREFCRGEVFVFLRQSISTLSDVTLQQCMAALKLLTLMAIHVPRILLARFHHKLPLTLACFRGQLPYSQRRVRAARLEFLLALTTSKFSAVSASVVVQHGCLTQALDDAAELLLEGTEQGVRLGRAALRMFEEQFIASGQIPVEQKRSVLLAQRNVFRLFVKALEYPAVAADAERLVYRLVAELIESPSDYATTRAESTEERGMPNFILFFLLRQLRPKNSALISRLVVFILHKAPDLIRPYLSRVSGHLPDEGNTAQRTAPATARIATLNVMTRILLAPIPYHLSAARITLEPIAARATTFYTMSPQAVVNEICPGWVAEYVHRIINGSANLMVLTLAMQLTQAALERAQTVLALVAQVQETQQQQRRVQPRSRRSHASSSEAADPGHGYLLDGDDEEVDEDGHVVDWESFDTQVQAALLQALPRREEFWHRMTQQIHPLLLAEQSEVFKASQQAPHAPPQAGPLSRAEFVAQRMFTLMQLYTDVFQLRVSWLSAVPAFVPTFSSGAMVSADGSRKPIIETALRLGNDVLCGWKPASVSALCALLVSSLMRGVSMTKLHHVTMSSQGGVSEWPVLMSLLLWAVRARETLAPIHDKITKTAAAAEEVETVNAVAWVARLVQWTVHSVTVRFGCEFEESLAWVLSLTPETLPCFLHLLNHLLQRSLSKAADRVAKELFEAEGSKGVLVAAAEAFIARTEEKQQQRAETAAAAPPTTQGPKKGKKGGQPNAAPAVDLWSENLYDNLEGLRAVVRRVEARWGARVTATSAFCAVLLKARAADGVAALEGPHGQRRIALTPSAVSSQYQQQQQQAQHEALIPPHTQLLEFGRTLHAPVTMTGEEEIELLVAIAAQDPLSDALLKDGAALAPMPAALARVGVRRWVAMHASCWEAAGCLLRGLNAVQSAPSASACGALAHLAEAILHQVADDATAAQSGSSARLVDRLDEGSLAFHVLLLALVRVLVTVKKLFPAVLSGLVEAPETASWVDSLETLLLSAYQGSVSTVDRVRYAALLSLHYLVAPANTHKDEEAEGEDESDSSADSDSVDEEEQAATASNNDENDDDTRESVDSSPGAATETKGAHVPARRSHTRQLFAGALVPRAFTQHRFLISGHSPAEYVTAEVDMLSLLVDAWTDDEIRAAALHTPVRLSNTILCGGRQSEWDLVRSVFPEVACEEDLLVTAFARVTSASVPDPRFLLPLLQTTLALPPEHVARTVTLGLRCLPLLLRALSCTESSMRALAATALSTLYIPSGPSRIVTTFARMKLLQLWQKQQQQRHHRGRRRRHGRAVPMTSTASPPQSLPRLPTPVGSLLILALQPLGEYAHPLHNHLIRFLVDARNALATPVPFARWLSAFPLEALSAPLMIKRHEELQKDGAHASSIAQTSAAEVAAQMRRSMPPQLDFILRLVSSACETNGDAMALLRSECVQNTMLLAELVSASPELRLSFVQTLGTMCASSYRVTVQVAVQARMLLWAVGFGLQLCREYAGSPHRFSDPLFIAVLELIATLSAVLAASPPTRHATLQGQAQELLSVLHAAVVDAHVTSKVTLDTLEKAMQVWRHAAKHRAGGAVADERLGRRLGAASAGTKRPHETAKGDAGGTVAAAKRKSRRTQ